MAAVATCPLKTMIGTLSIWAVASGVTVLVAPGPLVTMHTPGLPVARAYPSAQCPLLCSCRFRMNLAGVLYSWSNIGRMAPPGYPNIVSTLCGPTSISCRIWAPVLPLYFGRSTTAAAAGLFVAAASFCNIDMGCPARVSACSSVERPSVVNAAPPGNCDRPTNRPPPPARPMRHNAPGCATAPGGRRRPAPAASPIGPVLTNVTGPRPTGDPARTQIIVILPISPGRPPRRPRPPRSPARRHPPGSAPRWWPR